MTASISTVRNADELLQLGAGLMRIVRGHSVLRLVEAGNDIAATFDAIVAVS